MKSAQFQVLLAVAGRLARAEWVNQYGYATLREQK